MAAQSPALSAETRAMRSFDAAFQAAAALPAKARVRVLRYVEDTVDDKLDGEIREPAGGQQAP